MHPAASTPRPGPAARRWRAILALACAAAALPAHTAEPASGAGFSAGLSVQPLASATDIGLPVYPGATPLREGDDDSAGASLSLWGGAFGLQLRAMKLQSLDPVDKVARFYREAMARHGSVIDCSLGDSGPPGAASGAGKTLRCDSDRPRTGGRLYKVGVPGGVRMVAIDPAGAGSRVQMVRLDLRGE